MSAPFFTRRIYLDSVVKRGEKLGSEFYFGPFKSFWISATNNANFSAEMVVNHRDNSDRGLPLRLNQCQAFENKVENAMIEVPSAQAGVWIDVTCSQDEVLSVGSVSVSVSGIVSIIEGNSHLSAKVTATTAGAILIPADDTRNEVVLQNKSDVSVWVGNNTANELAHVDWKTICQEIIPGGSLSWRNPASLYGKTETVSADLSRITHYK